jgi:nucleotide-binding universal stress UspA family protein
MPVIGNQIGLAVDRIVLATDFGDTSEAATVYATALAKRFASDLTLAHVVDLSIATRSEKAVVGVPLDDTRRGSSIEMERQLRGFSHQGVRATGHALEARNPAAAVVGLSEQLKADLIIAGTHSRTGLKKLILGSCAEGIIRHATCPVLTVGPKAKVPSTGPFSFKAIVFATDFGSESMEKAAIALDFAQDSAAKIYLCHILEDSEKNNAEARESRIKAQAHLQNMIPESAYDWCAAECVAEQGEAASHILALAQRVGADLIVLGAQRRYSWLVYLNNGVVGDVLAEAECPVMTICSTS